MICAVAKQARENELIKKHMRNYIVHWSISFTTYFNTLNKDHKLDDVLLDPENDCLEPVNNYIS